MNEEESKWKFRFVFLIAYLIGYYFGGMAEKTDESISLEESKAIVKRMATDEFKNEFSTMLRTKYPLFYLSVNEERRFTTFLKHFCIIKDMNAQYGIVVMG